MSALRPYFYRLTSYAPLILVTLTLICHPPTPALWNDANLEVSIGLGTEFFTDEAGTESSANRREGSTAVLQFEVRSLTVGGRRELKG